MSLGQESEPKPRYWTVASLLNRHGELLRRRQFEEHSAGYLNEVEQFLHEAQAAGAFLDTFDDRRSAQNTLNYWSNVLFTNQRTDADATLAEFDPDLSNSTPLQDLDFPWEVPESKGLAGLFSQRQELSRQLVSRMIEGQRLLALMGPTGSGRSSLITDGLVPLLKTSAARGWRYLGPIAPGSAPLQRLAELLRPESTRDPLVLQLQLHPENILTELGPESEPSLLIVDRFEQLFTQCESAEQRQAFIQCLASMLLSPQPPHRVVVVIRTDYLSRATRLPGLGPQIAESLVRVTPFDARDLRQYVEGPSAEVGLHFEAGLIDHLVNDFLGDPSALPLLQLTLRELWDHREGSWITWKSYNQLGGGRMLERRAEELYRHAETSGDADALRNVLLCLVHLGPRAEVCSESHKLSTLYARGGGSRDSVDRVLEELKTSRFVDVHESADGELVFGLKHDAPATHWPRLAQWLEDARFQSVQRDRLRSAAENWLASDRSSESLWRGSLLKEAEAYPDLSALERDFVQAAQQAEQQAEQEKFRSKNRKIAALAVGFLMVLVLAVTAIMQRNLARREASRANREARRANQAATETNILAGMRAIEQGDPFDALPYLAQTIDPKNATPVVTRGGDGQLDVHRIRFDATLWQLPTLGRFLVQDIQCRQCDLSPNGLTLIAASGARGIAADLPDKVVVWDLQAGAQVGELPHPQRVNAAYFHPDGRRVATACEDQKLRVWNLQSREVIWEQSLGSAVKHLAISGDGQLIAAGSADGTLSVWRTDPATRERKVVSSPLGGPVVYVAFTSDAKRVVGASLSNASILDLDGGHVFPVLKHDVGSEVSHALFVSGDRYVVTASSGTGGRGQNSWGKVRVWDAHTGTLAGEADTHTDSISGLAISPRGDRVASAGNDGFARVWALDALTNADAGPRRLASLSNRSGSSGSTAPGLRLSHGSNVTSVAFSPDGRFLLTTSRDKTARVWDVTAESPDPVTPPLKHRGYVGWGAFTDSGRFVITASDDAFNREPGKQVGEVRVWAPEPKQPQSRLLVNSEDANFGRLGPGMLAVTTDGSKTASIWDFQTGKRRSELRHDDPVAFAAFHPSNPWIVTADEAGRVVLWELAAETPRRMDELQHPSRVSHLAFNESGQLLATAGDDGYARIWRCRAESSGYELVHELKHDHPVRFTTFGPGEQRYLFTACAERGANNRGLAQIWDLGSPASGPRLLRVQLASQEVPSKTGSLDDGIILDAAFNRAGTRLLTASTDDTARLWNVPDGTLVDTLRGHTADVRDVAFNADGTRYLTASVDQTVRIWNSIRGEPLTLSHDRAVVRSEFSSDGRLVVSATSNGTTRIWDAASGAPVTASSPRMGPVLDLRFSAEGRDLERLHGGDHARVSTWRLSLDQDRTPQMDQQLVELLSSSPPEASDAKSSVEPQASWNAIAQRFPELLRIDLTTDVPIDWHRSQVEQCEFKEQWAPARWHLDRLISADPDNARLLYRRAVVERKLADWQAAIDDCTRAIAVQPTDARSRYLRGRTYGELRAWDRVIEDIEESIRLGYQSEYAWYRLALVYLSQGNQERYEDTCRRMLTKFGGTSDAGQANITAWTWALGQHTPQEPAEALRLAEFAVKNGVGNRHYYLHTQAAVLFRSGHYEAASKQLRQTIAARPGDMSQTPWDLFFLALIEHRLGDPSAQASLCQAEEQTNEVYTQSSSQLSWDNRLELEILQKEASAVIAAPGS